MNYRRQTLHYRITNYCC